MPAVAVAGRGGAMVNANRFEIAPARATAMALAPAAAVRLAGTNAVS